MQIMHVCGETTKHFVGVGDAMFMDKWNESNEINSFVEIP